MERHPATTPRDGEGDMSLRRGSLLEIAAQASANLEKAGIKVAVVGGSAVTAYAPEIYTSKDIDFAAINGTSRREFSSALAELGFKPRGRDFAHSATPYTLDLVADTPYVDQRPITEFQTLKTRFGPVRVYKFEDAIADRIAAFLHWGDSQSLDVAERALHARASTTSWRTIRQAVKKLDVSLPEAARRLTLALKRLRAAHSSGMDDSKKRP